MAPQLKIHVDGKASVWRVAERGVLHLEVQSESTAKTQASADVQSTSAALTNKFRSYADHTASAAITTFSASAMTTSQFRPDDRSTFGTANQTYAEKAIFHSAKVTFEVVFQDMNLLAEMASELASMPHVDITRTEWLLTQATRDELEREARKKAIQDAVQKAKDYAEVVGREIVAVEITSGASSYLFGASTFGRSMQTARKAPQSMQMPPVQMAPKFGSSQAASSAAPPPEGPSVERGTITASASVSVDFVSVDGEPVKLD